MNQTTLVQIAERLEGLAGKLPEKIRRPVLRELIPLKQLLIIIMAIMVLFYFQRLN